MPGNACLEMNISTNIASLQEGRNTACAASSLTLMAAEIKWRADCTTSIFIWTPKFGRTVCAVYQHSIRHVAIPHDPYWGLFFSVFLGHLALKICFKPCFQWILLYLECLPFLQSPHHLFALDSTAVCGYWPNKNRAFIAPGGPFWRQITVDTNIPTLNSCLPAAVSSKSECKNSTLSSLPVLRSPCSQLATTWEQLPWFRPLVTPVSSSAPGYEDCPKLIPALIIFKAAGIYITLTQAPVVLQLPREAAFPSVTRWADIATTNSSRHHRNIWPTGCSWTLSKFVFFSLHWKYWAS